MAATVWVTNVLDAVIPHASNLQHVSLQTSIEEYVTHLEWIPHHELNALWLHEQPVREDLQLFSMPTEEDLFLQWLRMKPGLMWFINRPNVIFGCSYNGSFSLVGTVCVYAAICKHEGKPFWFPGPDEAWDSYSTASDADLIAMQHIWGALSFNAQLKAFNCSNGDVFKWKHLWKVLKKEFGIQSDLIIMSSNYKLSELMKDNGPVWEEIVRKNHLRKTKLEEVANWGFADQILRSCPRVDSMNKAKEHGFWEFKNSKKSFLTWIREYKAIKIVP